MTMPTNQMLIYFDLVLVATLFIMFFVWLLASEVIYAWVWAWYKKRPILIEWTKDKSWKFIVPHIDAGVPGICEVDGKKRAFAVRQEAVGVGPHKIKMMLVSSAFPSGISPKEVEGQRYFNPENSFWGVEIGEQIHAVTQPTEEEVERFLELESKLGDKDFLEKNPAYTEKHAGEYQRLQEKIGLWENRRLWVKYPPAGLEVKEFVKHQRIETDPKLMASYVRRREIQVKADMQSPINTITAAAPALIPLLVILAIVWYMVGQANVASNAMNDAQAWQTKYNDLYKTCDAVGQVQTPPKEPVTAGTGAVVK